jgi:predicted PurR-regulated permease PerM
VNKFIIWISIICSIIILYVGGGFIAPVLSGLILAFGLRPFEDSFVFKWLPSPRARMWALLLSFLAVFTTLSTYVVIASAKGIARNVHLKGNLETVPEPQHKIFKEEVLAEKDQKQENPPTNESSSSEAASSAGSELVFAETVEQPDGVVEKAKHFIGKIPGVNAEEIAKIWAEMLSRAQSLALFVLSRILTAGPAIFLQWVIFMISFVIFFLGYESLLAFFHSFDKKSKDVRDCVTFFQNATQATLMGTLVVGTAQASIITLGTAIAGFESFVLLGLCAFFASFVPFFGTAIVWVSALLYALVNGDTQAAIIVGVAGAMSSVADNLILPTFIGAKNKVHPLLLFIVVIGFIELIGIWGLFIGPVVSIFSTRVFELWYKKTV